MSKIFATATFIHTATVIMILFTHSAQASTAPPVAYWSFDETSGATVTDHTGNGNTGTLQFNTQRKGFSDCKISGCLQFDGIDDFVDFGSGTTLHITGPSTIEAWFRFNTILPTDNRYIYKRSGNNGMGLANPTNSGKISFSFNDGGTTYSAVSSLNYNDDKWHFAAGTYDGSTISLYIDGSPVASNPASGTVFYPTLRSTAGRNANEGNRYWEGMIDDIRIFDYARTAQQIALDFQATNGGSTCDVTDPICPFGLKCEDEERCVPIEANRAVGTWCSQATHCDPKTGTLLLTCSKQNICVGATANAQCLDFVVNQNPTFGLIASELDSRKRCDIGLVCDPDKGSCQNDFGQTTIPFDKLGDTAKDIRDQIRTIINIALGFLGVAGVVVVLYGGFVWMFAMGEEQRVEKGKKTLISGAIGLIIIGIAWTIVSWVLNLARDVS